MHDMVGLIMHVHPHCAFLSALPISALRSSRRDECYLSSLLAGYGLPSMGEMIGTSSISITQSPSLHIIITILCRPSRALRLPSSANNFNKLRQRLSPVAIKLFICLASQNYHPLFSDKCAPTQQDLALSCATSGCWKPLLWGGLRRRRRRGIGREGMGIDGIFKYLDYKNIRQIQHRFELLSRPQ